MIIELFTCIFTGIIAFCAGWLMLIATPTYDGRNVTRRWVDKKRKEAGMSTTPRVNLWTALPVKFREWKLNRKLRKSK